MEEIVQKVVANESPSSPMNKVIVNSIEAVEYESNKEATECVIQLQATQVERKTKNI